ncbi:MAG TPA: motility protein MotB [Holosporales bacterium]|nr:motility protein MotB [Holosporales bacterium]
MADKKEIRVIKKIFKKGGHVHHGGAWKIAYADFVTAMMAFFMLMWLINVITEEQKKGIADYFTPNFTKIHDGDPTEEVLARKEAIPSEEEDNPLIKMKKKLEQSLLQNKNLKSLMDNIHITLTSAGLNIDIIDTDGRSMFTPGGAEMLAPMKDILNEVAIILNNTVNKISIAGHTDAIQYTNTKNYSNWELSVDRANATRKKLEKIGVDRGRMQAVQGKESRELFDPSNPSSPKNRRIAITLLK